jgi:hypothetical protein
MSDRERKRIDREMDRLLKEREVFLKYGSSVDANKITDQIGALEKERQEAQRGRENK